MSLPVNLQMGLSSDGFGIRTPEVQEDLTTNPIIAVGDNASVLSIINQRIQNNKLVQYRFPLDLPKYNFTIIQHSSLGRDISIVDGIRRTLSGIDGIYRLPLPSRLVDSHSTAFADLAPLSIAENIAKMGFGSYRTAEINKIKDALNKKNRSDSWKERKAAKQIKEKFGGIDAIVDQLSKARTGAESLADIYGAIAGTKIAHAKVVAVTSPEFRTFALSWHFVPKSFDESLQIQRICYNLRKNMTPELTNKFVYIAQFPSVYTMFFQPNVKFLYKFKPCVLTSITVSYSTGGIPSFYKQQDSNPQFSPPESVRLDTTWMELDYFVQQHYEEDHNDTEDLPSSDPYGLLKSSFTFNGGGSSDNSSQFTPSDWENFFP